jgi:hypothetical protein
MLAATAEYVNAAHRWPACGRSRACFHDGSSVLCVLLRIFPLIARWFAVRFKARYLGATLAVRKLVPRGKDMSAASLATLRKCLMVVPALGTFGPIAMVMGPRDSSFFSYVISLLGALATGTAIAILGNAAMRFFPEGKDRESDRSL